MYCLINTFVCALFSVASIQFWSIAGGYSCPSATESAFSCALQNITYQLLNTNYINY